MSVSKDFKVKNGVSLGTSITFESATAGGVLSWNSIDQTLDITLNSQVTLQTGQEQLFYAKATAAIANGDVVMFAGAQGDHLLIAKADMQSVGFKPEYVIGVATQSFSTNDFGFVSAFGKVRGLNTNGFTEGTILYLNPSVAGALTSTEPTNGSHVLQMAAVVKQHATQGTIFVRPTHKPHLDEIQGVNISSPTDGQALTWNASTSKWVNTTVVASVNGVTGAVTATNLLDAVKTVDGAGSGLDADLLDGQHASYYTNEAINNAIALSIALG